VTHERGLVHVRVMGVEIAVYPQINSRGDTTPPT
jgi:hypothetical protein